MATIHKEFLVQAPPEAAWDAIRDVGAVHTRLARGFVIDTALDGDTRTVTFANGLVARERIVAVSDPLRRLAYTSVGGRASHHHASLQVFPAAGGQSRLLWITDLLPDDLHGPVSQMVEHGASAIQATLGQGGGGEEAD